MTVSYLTLVGSDHFGAGFEYVRSWDLGCAYHEGAIDVEVTVVPEPRRCIEGTTFVTESVYVAVGV